MCLKAKKIKIKINGKQKKGDKTNTKRGGLHSLGSQTQSPDPPFLRSSPSSFPSNPETLNSSHTSREREREWRSTAVAKGDGGCGVMAGWCWCFNRLPIMPETLPRETLSSGEHKIGRDVRRERRWTATTVAGAGASHPKHPKP